MIVDKLAKEISNKVKFKKQITKECIDNGQWNRDVLTVDAECKIAFIDINKI